MIKKILVSQPKPASNRSPYYDIATRHNVEFFFRPFIKVEGLSAREFREQRISLAGFTAIVFTSCHAIDHFFALCQEMRLVIPSTMKYFCISEQISLYIQKYVQYRKRRVFFGPTGKIDDLIPAMAKHKNERYFVPLSDVHTDDLKNKLDACGLRHTEGVMYRTVAADFLQGQPFDYDMIVLFSPSGVQSLLQTIPDFKQGETCIATFGPTTAQAVKAAGLRLDLEAPTSKYTSITAALDDYLKEHNKG